MSQQTEAACLLEAGALYGTRVMLRPEAGEPIFAGFKAGAFSLYFGDEPIYHFDFEGRWQRAFLRGTHYLKGLDTTSQAIDRVREGENLVLKRRTLGSDEANNLDARVRSTALDLLEALDAAGLERVDPPSKARPLSSDALREFLQRIARWDAAAWQAHRDAYHATYGLLPLLPPDCQNALVLQATLGHAGGIAFGHGSAFEHVVRTPEVFANHAQAVSDLLGRRISQCRSVFLGGSDVLRRPPADVASYLETIGHVFPMGAEPSNSFEATPRLEGIHAFLDDLSPPRPGAERWREFRALHLRRVTLGVESGAPEVRALYRKTWNDEELVATVSEIKAGGVGVGIAVLVDAGGAEHAERHLDATAQLFNRLELGPGDLVALLDADEVRDPRIEDPGYTLLDGLRRSELRSRLKQALSPLRTVRGAKVVPYSLEKQIG